MITNREPVNATRHPVSALPEQRSQAIPEPPLHLAAHHQHSTPPDIRKTGLRPDYWYPLAKSEQVARGKTLGVSFAGEPIVLVRTERGDVFALENRCAHRQVPLEAGVIRGELLQCCYHGWTYDATGTCVNVPYLDKAGTLPKGVRSYPCREAYGLIFVYPGDPARLGEVRFPQIPNHGDRDYKTRYLDRRIACHYSFMHENLMDMNHQFLHRRLMGGIKTIFLGSRVGDTWAEATYTFKRNSGKQPLGERFMINRSAEPAQEGERDRMVIRTDYPYQSLKFWTAGAEYPALDLWNCYIPVDRAQRINHTYGMIMIRRPSKAFLLDIAWPIIIWFTNGIFAEDRVICELEQAAFDAQGKDCNQEIFPAIRNLRRVLVENGRAI